MHIISIQSLSGRKHPYVKMSHLYYTLRSQLYMHACMYISMHTALNKIVTINTACMLASTEGLQLVIGNMCECSFFS